MCLTCCCWGVVGGSLLAGDAPSSSALDGLGESSTWHVCWGGGGYLYAGVGGGLLPGWRVMHLGERRCV